MEIFQLRVFQRQILDQCQFLMFAAEEVNAGIKTRNTDRIFYAIQNLLNAGANISKMCWGSKKSKMSDARKPLRDSIGIADSSPLRNVTMRNNFEHMDERIDRWWAESKRHNIADRNIGPKDRTIVGMEPTDMFRLFDPQTAIVTFWGEEFNIQALATEAERLLPRLREEADKPHWDPSDLKLSRG